MLARASTRKNGDMRVSTPDPESNGGWLSGEDLDYVRRRVPILYVEAIPVRLAPSGELEHIGLLLQANEDGVMTRAFVSGRVNYGESLRDTLNRHLEKDLGPMALPQLPACLTPVTVAEYSPIPGARLVDERQHAVSLVYVVPVSGECDPCENALEVSWLTPGEALDPDLLEELEGGRARILKTVIGQLSAWP